MKTLMSISYHNGPHPHTQNIQPCFIFKILTQKMKMNYSEDISLTDPIQILLPLSNVCSCILNLYSVQSLNASLYYKM